LTFSCGSSSKNSSTAKTKRFTWKTVVQVEKPLIGKTTLQDDAILLLILLRIEVLLGGGAIDIGSTFHQCLFTQQQDPSH